jgi:hypothetical protein
MLEHEGAYLLTMNAKGLNPGCAGTNEIAHRLMAFVRYPYRGEFAGTQKLREPHGIAPVRLYPVARLPWNQRRRHDHARVTKHGDEPVKAIARWTSLVAEMHLLVLRSDPFHQAAHALLGGINLSEITDLAATLAIGDRNRVACFGNVDPDKNLCRITHGSSSCDEDRLGPPEQPSLAQSRTSHLNPGDGHTVLLSGAWLRRKVHHPWLGGQRRLTMYLATLD